MKLPPITHRQRVLQKVLPPHLTYALRFELKMIPVRLRAPSNRRQYRGRRHLRLNIGAGARGQSDWTNIDAFDAPNITCVHDCRWSLPFDDGSADVAFTEHFLEHLERTVEVPRFLREVHRVLRPGGVVRIVVPDIEPYLKAYCQADWDAFTEIRPLHGRRDRWFDVEYETPLEMAQYVMRQVPVEPHQYAYDAETLELVLRQAGFADVVRLDYGESAVAGLALDHQERASESLYLEASKR